MDLGRIFVEASALNKCFRIPKMHFFKVAYVIKWTTLDCSHSIFRSRSHRSGGVISCSNTWQQWTGVCNECHSRHPIPTDTANASRWSARRYMALTWFGCFYSSAGKFSTILLFQLNIHGLTCMAWTRYFVKGGISIMYIANRTSCF